MSFPIIPGSRGGPAIAGGGPLTTGGETAAREPQRILIFICGPFSGSLVSGFPAWVFRERRREREGTLIACRLAPRSLSSGVPDYRGAGPDWRAGLAF